MSWIAKAVPRIFLFPERIMKNKCFEHKQNRLQPCFYSLKWTSGSISVCFCFFFFIQLLQHYCLLFPLVVIFFPLNNVHKMGLLFNTNTHTRNLIQLQQLHFVYATHLWYEQSNFDSPLNGTRTWLSSVH